MYSCITLLAGPKLGSKPLLLLSMTPVVDWPLAEPPLPVAAAAEPAEVVLPAELALLEAPRVWVLLDAGLGAASAGGFCAAAMGLLVLAAPALAVLAAPFAELDAALLPCAAALDAGSFCGVDLAGFPALLLPPAWLLVSAALLLFNTSGAVPVPACSPSAAVCGGASKPTCC